MSPVTSAPHGAVTVITVDNPPVNALSQAVREGIASAVAIAEADDTCEAIIITCGVLILLRNRL